VSGYHHNAVVPVTAVCPNNHKNELKVTMGKIVDVKTCEVSDIEKYIDVPPHIRDIVREAYICLSYGAHRAGTCAIRLVLDALLFAQGFQDRMTFTKVVKLETRCRRDYQFRQNRGILCQRINTFKDLAGLSGYYVHAQKHVDDVIPSEFKMFLCMVEAAVKNCWPRKV